MAVTPVPEAAMTTHPDADALMRAVLDHLDDRVSRLVFADWLDETGTPSSAAWAAYLRLANADAPPDPDELARVAAGIRARLTVHTRFFLNRRRDLLQILPAANIHVRLAEFHPPRQVVEWVPESLARENLVIPLDSDPPFNSFVTGRRPDRLVVFAAADLRNSDTPRNLAFTLNATIQLVGADPADLAQAINRVYGEAEAIRLDSQPIGFYEPGFLLDADDDPPIARLARLLLTEALNINAVAIQVRPTKEGAQVTYLIDSTWTDRDAIPHRILPPLADQFRVMAGLNPDASHGRVEFGMIRFPYRDRRYIFVLEITELGAGPDVLLQLHDPGV